MLVSVHRTVSAGLCLALICSCSDAPVDSVDQTDVGPGDAADTDIEQDGSSEVEVSPGESCAHYTRGFEHVVGEWTVTVDQLGAWQIQRASNGGASLSGPPSCGADSAGLALGSGTPEIQAEMGQFRINLEGGRSRIDWAAATGPNEPPVVGEDSLRLPIGFSDDSTGELRFDLQANGDLQIELRADSAEAGLLHFDCAVDESFFGLGTQAFGLDLRGGTYPLWTQEQGIGKPEDGGLFPLNNVLEAAYAPMGVWHSSNNYSLITARDGFQVLDMCETDPTRVVLGSYPELPKVLLVAGDTLRERLTRVTAEYVGRMSEPADWVFGPWNDAVGGPAHVREVAETLRENRIPSSAIWSEDWIGGEQGLTGYHLTYAWEWDSELYPDLPDDIAWLHDHGFAFLAYFNPFVPSTTRMFEEGLEGDFLILDQEGEPYTFLDPFFRTTSLVDLWNPDALDWVEGYLTTAAEELQIDGWMADFAEWFPIDAMSESGLGGWELHNLYPLEWQHANRRVLSSAHAEGDEPANNWVFFSRSGWASAQGGTAGVAPTMWAGDQNTDWGYDDGLPSVIPIATHAGLAGVAVFGTDIAGFTAASSPPTTKELFFRWSTLGAFHGLMRTHHGSDECRNWVFQRDEETLLHYKRYATIHTLLLPYFKNLAKDAMDFGWPLMRHPALVEPEFPALWTGQDYVFFLGDELLVSPVLEEGQLTRVVELPGPGWWPLLGTAPESESEEGEGGLRTLSVASPPTEIPVFVRPGAILPLLGSAVDSFYGSEVDEITDLQATKDWYRLALYPTDSGSLRPTNVEGASVEGSMFPEDADWSTAIVNSETVEACNESEDNLPCYRDQILTVYGDELEIEIGGGTLGIVSDEERTYSIGIAGAAWFGVETPTELTDLNPEVDVECD